jgi:hypothetical protein
MQAMRNSSAATSTPESVNNQEPDTLYYLKVTCRSLNDVLLFGPYTMFWDVLLEITREMKRLDSDVGIDTLEELVAMPGFRSNSLVFFNAPLANGSVAKFDIIREENPEAVTALSGEAGGAAVFSVRINMPLTVPEGMIPGVEGRCQLQDVEHLASFTSGPAAASFAEQQLLVMASKSNPPQGRLIGARVDNQFWRGVMGIIERFPVQGHSYDGIVQVVEHSPRS